MKDIFDIYEMSRCHRLKINTFGPPWHKLRYPSQMILTMDYISTTGQNGTEVERNTLFLRWQRNLSVRDSPFVWLHEQDHEVHCHKKGAHLNTIERFYIHIKFAKNNHLNDPQTILPKAIIDTIIKNDRPLNPATAKPPQPHCRHSSAP